MGSALSALGAARPDRADDPLRLVMGHARVVPPGGPDSHRLAEHSREGDAAPDGALGMQQANPGAVTALTHALSDFARLLAALPGRKQVVYFSAGFDGKGLASSDAAAGGAQAVDGVERMLEELRRADCVVQAVDLGGLPAGGEPGGTRTAARQTLLTLAHGTGGELFEGSNDLSPAMSGLLQRTSLTYVLSFQPDPVKPDGAYHELRVELKNVPPGTRVAFRPGWYAPRPYKELKPLEKLFAASAKVMGGVESGAIGSAVLAAPFRGGGGAGDRAYVPVLIEVDGPALLAGRPGGVLPVEVYVYALDADGAIQGFLFQTLGLDLAKTEAPLRQSGLKFVGHLDLPAGDYSLRTLIRNGATGAYSLRVAPLTVPVFTAGPVLLPPLFPEPANRWLVIHEAQRGEQVPYPFIARQQPFLPASRPALAAGQEIPVALMGYNLAAGDLRAEARVLTPDGKESGGGELRVLGRESGGAAGPDRLAATFKPPRLPPGEYLLRVTLTGAGGPVGPSSAPFVVGR